MNRIKRLFCRWLRGLGSLDEFDFEKQCDWYSKFKPSKGTHGPLVLEHARRVYDEHVAALRHIDDKASDLLKLGATLATLAVGFSAASRSLDIRASIPSLICFLVAMILATISRTPGLRTSQMTARQALDQLPEAEDQEAKLAASLHCACVALRASQRQKTCLTKWSSWAVCAGVLLLLFLGLA